MQTFIIETCYTYYMSQKVLSISLTDDLWKQVDTERKDVSRSVWVKRAIEAKLGDKKIE
jgi:metal-responsive CopG/Arc/MetJ family transcriptional regulator